MRMCICVRVQYLRGLNLPGLGPHNNGVLFGSKRPGVDALLDMVFVSFSALPRCAVFCDGFRV